MSCVVENGLGRGEFVFRQVAPFQQGPGRWGQIGIVSPGAEVGEKDGKVLGRRRFQAVAQVGVVHLVLDNAKGESRIAPYDHDLADRVARNAVGTGQPALWSRTLQGQSANAGNNRGGPALLVHVTNFILGGHLAGADHLDPVPGHPVGWFAAQSFDAQPLIEAGRPVDRTRGTQLGELVGSPGLGGHLVFIQPVEQLANCLLVDCLGPHPGGACQPLHHVRRVHSGGLTDHRAQILGAVDGIKDHQAVSGCRVGHGQRELPVNGERKMETPSTFPTFPVGFASCRCHGLAEQVGDDDREARQYRPAVECGRGSEPRELVGCCVDVDNPGPGPYQPDQPDAFAEIVFEFLFHFLPGVPAADDLDDKVGNQVGDRFLRKLAVRDAIPGNKSHVGNPDSTQPEPVHTIGSRGKALVFRENLVVDHREYQSRNPRFFESHGLLHQDAVNQFAKPILVVIEPDDVGFGGRAGCGVPADPAEWNGTEPPLQVGDGPFLRGCFAASRSGGHETISSNGHRLNNATILTRPLWLGQAGRVFQTSVRVPTAPGAACDGLAAEGRAEGVYRSASCVIFDEFIASNRRACCSANAVGSLGDAVELPGERPLRQIGTLPRNLDSQVFGDHLLALGMKARFDEQPDGWLVWIYNEDQLARACAELEAYVRQPDDPRFQEAATTAREVRRNQARLEKEYRKNFREVTDLWAGMRFRRRPLTLALVFVSVVIFILGQTSRRMMFQIENTLMITAVHLDPLRGEVDDGLSRIYSGEVWRLVTPIFLHFGLLHILFNSWAITLEGTMIETVRGTLRLAILVLVSAVLSNLGQYIFMDRYSVDGLHLFGGLSGVGYALFGYLWMKGQYEPEQGMILHPNTISTMLLWLVLCMTGLLGPIANAAHVVGLVVGIAFGVSRF